ncbi:hypothetical protein GIB67_024889 [Kingdonia uniflora]|uniref:Bifunctional inhibitor/plant lipid transfer protein/seed storage helical domain-containing protein n=1 Tax=Kingdonia uniflora TaxID=39325 RepID=A0A7J7NYM2_9MAGN|nr:hypothetical protein GIB67_024889 [Kingdonia uniflora]
MLLKSGRTPDRPRPLRYTRSLNISNNLISIVFPILVLFVTLYLSHVACRGHHHAPSVSPSVAPSPPAGTDCSTLVFELAPYLSFLGEGSTDTKPDSKYCNALKDVVKIDAQCLCESFNAAAQMGVVIDVKRAVALPSACGIVIPPFEGTCGLVAPPAGSPVNPAPSREPTGMEAPATVPVPSTPTKSLSVVPIPFLVVLASLAAASALALLGGSDGLEELEVKVHAFVIMGKKDYSLKILGLAYSLNEMIMQGNIWVIQNSCCLSQWISVSDSSSDRPKEILVASFNM